MMGHREQFCMCMYFIRIALLSIMFQAHAIVNFHPLASYISLIMYRFSFSTAWSYNNTQNAVPKCRFLHKYDENFHDNYNGTDKCNQGTAQTPMMTKCSFMTKTADTFSHHIKSERSSIHTSGSGCACDWS